MQSVKIRLKQMDGTAVPPVVNFKIIEFGLLSGDHVPIISKKAAQNVAKFNLNGRMLSMLSSAAKPVSVQVINLQGSLVHSQALASGSINLSHLPAGVYIVRSPELGYSGRIMLK
jgi:Fe2+ transport system protein FeoA